MVATVLIREWNGSSAAPVQTSKQGGTIRFKSADNAVVNTSSRLIIPTLASSQLYSFQKWVRLEISVVPSVDIDNLRAYSDGASGWGVGVKGWYRQRSTYETPVAPATADDPPKGPGSTVDMIDFFTAISTASADMDAGNAGPFTTTGDIGDWLALVMEAESSAVQGQTPTEPLTFAYDET